jgi:hypothetical protein
MAMTGTVQGGEIMTPYRREEEPLEHVLARLHALRRNLDALYRNSEARLRQAEERIQHARQQVLLSRLLLQELRAHRRELPAWGLKRQQGGGQAS